MDKAKIMAVGMWTSAPPTKPGWYWKRRAWHENDRILTTEQGIVFVDQYLQLPGLGVIGTAEEYASRVGNVEWAGPIHDPDDAICAEEAGVQEPVAFMDERENMPPLFSTKRCCSTDVPLYRAPPSAQSLIDAAREECARVCDRFVRYAILGAGGLEPGDRLAQVSREIRALLGQPLNEAKGG